MGNLGCFDNKAQQSLVSLKMRPVDENAEDAKRRQLSKLTSNDLKSRLYDQQQILERYIREDILSPTLSKQKRSQALEETFTHWNDLSMIIQYIRQVQATSQLEAEELKVKRMRQMESIQMRMTSEIKQLKEQLEKNHRAYELTLQDQQQKFNQQFKEYHVEVEGKIEQANQNVKVSYQKYLDSREENVQLQAKIESLQKLLGSAKQEAEREREELDKCKLESEQAQERIDDKKVELQSVQLKEQISSIRAKNQTIQAESERLREQNALLRQEVSSLQEVMEDLQAKLHLGVKAQQQLTTLKEEVQTMRQEITSKDQQLESLKQALQEKVRQEQRDHSQTSKAREELQSNLEAFKAKEDQLNSRIGQLQQAKLSSSDNDADHQISLRDNDQLRARILQMQSSNARMIESFKQQTLEAKKQSQQALAQATSKLEQAAENTRLEKEALNRLQRQLDRVRNDSAQLKAGKSQLTEQMVNKFTNDIRQLTQDKDQLQQELDLAMKERLAVVQGMAAQLEANRVKYAANNSQILERENQVVQLKNTIQRLQIELSQLQQAKQSSHNSEQSQAVLQQQLRNRELTEEITTYSVKLEALEQSNSQLGETLKEAKTQAQSLHAQVDSLLEQNTTLQRQLQEIKSKDSERVQANSNQLSKHQQQVARLKQMVKEADQKAVVQASQQGLASQKIEQLEEQKGILERERYIYLISLTILPLSDIIQDPAEKIAFKQFFGKDLLNSKLLYRATQRSFWYFHEVCDQRADIVTVIRANNRVFGCYTPFAFDPQTSPLDQNQQSFIFSMTDNRKFPLLKGKPPLIYDPALGPAFGKDIVITLNNGVSEFGRGSYNPQDVTAEPSKYLAGQSEFQIQEYQVYMLWFG